MTSKECLREIETDLRILDSISDKLGIKSIARSTLAYANEHRPVAIFESLFYVLFKQWQSLSQEQRFSFKNPLHTIDATSVSLCVSLFDWTKFRTQKGTLRIHTNLNIRNQIPDILDLTDGKTHNGQRGAGHGFFSIHERNDLRHGSRVQQL